MHSFRSKILAFVAALTVTTVAFAATYSYFSPGGALSGTWNSQTVALDSGAFITGILPDANFVTTGSFSANYTGCNAVVTATATYRIVGGIVSLQLANPTCTSNAATFTIDNVPVAIRPASGRLFAVGVVDNGAVVAGRILAQNSTNFPLGASIAANGGFTATGQKGLGNIAITYPLTP